MRPSCIYRNMILMLLALMTPCLHAKQAYQLMTLRNDGGVNQSAAWQHNLSACYAENKKNTAT